MSNLPAYPDNLHALGDGTFWLGYVGGVPWVSTQGWFIRNKTLRSLVMHLPAFMRPKTIAIGGGAHIDGNGRVLATVLDRTGAVVSGTASGMLLGEDTLLMGNLHHAYIAVTDLPSARMS